MEPLESVADEECCEGVQLMSLPSRAELDVCLPMLGPESCLCQAITETLNPTPFFQDVSFLSTCFLDASMTHRLTLGPKGQLKEVHITSGKGREGAQACSLQPS